MQDKTITLKAPPIDLQWLVFYKDGSKLDQNYGAGEENGEHHFGHIDLEKLNIFCLKNKFDDIIAAVYVNDLKIVLNDLEFKIDFGKDASNIRLVYFRRIRNDIAPSGQIITVRHCIGLQALVNGKNKQQLIFIEPDGTFTLSQKK